MTLYLQVAQDFETQIRQGLIEPGDRLPSVRELSRNRKISVSTALQAYLSLEARGLIEARPQSGFYALAPLSAAAECVEMPKAQVRMGQVKNSEIVGDMRKVTGDVFQLSCAMLEPEIFPLKKLSRLMTDVARRCPEAMVKLDFPPGNPRLRKEISKRYSQLGCKVAPNDIVLTSGCNEAIGLALRAVTKPGDAVLVESPTYFGMLEILRTLGLRAVEVPSDAETGISLEAAKEAIEKYSIAAGFVTPNFNNPTGALMTDENKQKLVALFAKKNIPLIEDDIFSELSFAQNRPKSLKAFDDKGIVITVGSFSKTLGAGLRVGWIIAGRWREEIEDAKYLLNGGTTLAMTEVIANYLESGSYDRYLRKLRQTLAVRVARVSEIVARSFPEGTQITRPQGGYVLWVRLPEKTDALKLYMSAVSEKISFAPGVIFSPSGRFTNYLRISCGAWSESTRKAIQKLGKLAH